METAFPVTIDPADRANRNELRASQMIVQQYARYPSTQESALQSASSLGSAQSQRDVHTSPAAIPPSAVRSGPSMSPPLFEAIRQHQIKGTTDQVESRELPPRDVTDGTIDDAYVLFILYCNPNVPSSVDTSELRRAFRCPPRSDGKSFDIFTLFGLIRKLQTKELKTWIQLAMELGVEPPSMERKQSTQKVQQYTVRLKRWMHAMHVDAFFEYCIGNSHSYYTQLPQPGPFVGETRDGVALEEDLALRALVPQWKPKRGRKRAEERDIDEDKASKRPKLDTSVGALHQGGFQDYSATFPQSAIPFSAYPDADGHDPWMTASSAFPAATASEQGQDLRWRLPGRDTSPANCPRSAIISRGNHPSDALLTTGPRSAVTPVSGEKSRSRRSHGPAVSSAWPSSNGSASGKPRGRPPNKPTSSSFSTFLLSTNRDSPQSQPNSATQASPLTVVQNPPNNASNSHNQSPTPANNGRPSKLQLQVPQHVGAPVRLATPPTLLVNGVNDTSVGHAGGSQELSRGDSTGAIDQPGVAGADPRISVNDLVRTLSSELLQARLTGRPTPLSSEEARAVASAMMVQLSTIYSQLPHGLPPSFMAFQIGVGHHFGLPTPNGTSIHVNVDHHVSDISPSQDEGCAGQTTRTQYTVTIEYKEACHFSVQVTLSDPNFSTSGVEAARQSLQNAEVQQGSRASHDAPYLDLGEDGLDDHVSEATWKQQYLKLRSHMQQKERALLQYKRKIIDSVMADI